MARWPSFKRKHPMGLSLMGVEELGLFPDDAARDKAIEEYATSVKGWDFVWGISICVVVAIASALFARYAFVGGLGYILPWPLPGFVREILSLGTVLLCMFLTIRLLHRWGVRKEMRKRLLDLGVPVCMNCGYLLRGLPDTTPACPECGKTIDDAVRALLREPVAHRPVDNQARPTETANAE